MAQAQLVRQDVYVRKQPIDQIPWSSVVPSTDWQCPQLYVNSVKNLVTLAT